MKHIIAIDQQSVQIGNYLHSWLPQGRHLQYTYHFFHSSTEKRATHKDIHHYFYSSPCSLWSEAYSSSGIVYADFASHFQENVGDVVLVYDAINAIGAGGASYLLEQLTSIYPTLSVVAVPIFLTSAAYGPAAINALLAINSALHHAHAIMPRYLLDASYLMTLMKVDNYHLSHLLQVCAGDVLLLVLHSSLAILSSRNKIIDVRSTTYYSVLKPAKRPSGASPSALLRRVGSNVHAIDEYCHNTIESNTKQSTIAKAQLIVSGCEDDTSASNMSGLLKGAAAHVVWPSSIKITIIPPPTLAAPVALPLAALFFPSPYAVQLLREMTHRALEATRHGAYLHWLVFIYAIR